MTKLLFCSLAFTLAVIALMNGCTKKTGPYAGPQSPRANPGAIACKKDPRCAK